MKIGTITFSAAIIGAIWGAVWMIVIGILLMLVSGITASPPAGTALFVGLIAGLSFILLPMEKTNDQSVCYFGRRRCGSFICGSPADKSLAHLSPMACFIRF